MTEAWIEFETAVGRGRGQLRLDGRGRLDAADHALRAQGPRGAEGPRPAHGRRARREPRPGDLGRAARAGGRASWATRPSPTCSSSAAARAASRWAPGCGSSGVPTIVIDKRGPPRRPVAQPLQVAVPARPGLVRPPALHQVPRQLAGVRPEGQDRRLARVLHQGDGAQLLDAHRGEERVVRRGDGRVDRRGRARRPAARAATQAARARHRDVRQAEPAELPRAWTGSAATSTTPPPTRARTRTPARRSSSSARTTPPSTSAERCGRRAPTSRWCSGPRPTSCGRTR